MTADGGGTNYSFSVAVIGDHGVGKTSLIRHLQQDVEDLDFTARSVGVHISEKTIEHVGRSFHVEVHDLPGSSHFLAAADIYCAPMAGIACVFDVCRYDSFVAVQDWLDKVYGALRAVKRPRPPVLILLGNKADVPAGRRREVSGKSARAFAQEKGIPYFETSAAVGDNVEGALMSLIETVAERVVVPEHKQANALDLKGTNVVLGAPEGGLGGGGKAGGGKQGLPGGKGAKQRR